MLVLYLKDPIHICLEPKAQVHGMTCKLKVFHRAYVVSMSLFSEINLCLILPPTFNTSVGLQDSITWLTRPKKKNHFTPSSTILVSNFEHTC